MHRFTWVLQILFGVYFVAVGVVHFIVPEGLPATMSWMYELPTRLHVASGTVEILGGLGLVLPAITGIRRELVPWAAAGLAVVMIVAASWHLPREEFAQIAGNLIMAALLAFVAWVRWRRHPLGAASRTDGVSVDQV